MSFHNNNNQFTSTMIDDEDSIEELRRYGEKNLPTLKTSNRKKGSSTANILTDQNREIYLKKLNHYKARENIEKNPSKQYLKTKQINNTYDYEDNEDQEDSDNDVICLEKSEFVQVANAHTSPMSMSTFNYKDYFDSPSVLTSTQAPHLRKSGVGADYVKLKDRMELDKTMSKYRQDINNIINNSIVRNRTVESSVKKCMDEIINEGSSVSEAKRYQTSEVLYCPKPEIHKDNNTSLFNSLRKKLFTNKSNSNQEEEESPYEMLKQIRGGRIGTRTVKTMPPVVENANLPAKPSTIRKEANNDFLTVIGNFIQLTIFPFISRTGLQISKLLPYLVIIIFTVIMLQYFNMKFLTYKKSLPENFETTNNINFDTDITKPSEPSQQSEHFYCSDIDYDIIDIICVNVIMFYAMLVTLVLAYLIYLTLKRRLDNDKIYYDLITKGITLMVEQYELSLLDPEHIKPFIAISHIYDTFFDPSQRQSKKKLWNKIVDFIQDHESRIHLETQFIDGEETHVWKWIVPKHDSSKISTRFKKDDGIGLANSTMITNSELAKQSTGSSENMNNENKLHSNTSSSNNISNQNGWQGDAFNRSDKLTCSPTPCLKIRNMFDSISIENDALYCVRIHNDILEKCSQSSTSSNSILHISCDKKSKESCVYVKCSSNEAAGFVYQQLNGTWYNGRLLNVKFLRSDRYMERFPESVNYNQPLKPIRI